MFLETFVLQHWKRFILLGTDSLPVTTNTANLVIIYTWPKSPPDIDRHIYDQRSPISNLRFNRNLKLSTTSMMQRSKHYQNDPYYYTLHSDGYNQPISAKWSAGRLTRTTLVQLRSGKRKIQTAIWPESTLLSPTHAKVATTASTYPTTMQWFMSQVQDTPSNIYLKILI